MNIKNLVSKFPISKVFVDLSFGTFDSLISKNDSEKNYIVPENAMLSGFLDMFKASDKESVSKSMGGDNGVLGMLFKGKLPKLDSDGTQKIYDILQKTDICEVEKLNYPKDQDTLVLMGEQFDISELLESVDNIEKSNYVFFTKNVGDLAEYLSEMEGVNIYKVEKELVVSSVELDLDKWDGFLPIQKIKYRKDEDLDGFCDEIRTLLQNAMNNGELEGWNPADEESEPWVYIEKIETNRVVYYLRGKTYSLGWQEVKDGGHELVFPEVEVKAIYNYVELSKNVDISQRALSKSIMESIQKVKLESGDESTQNVRLLIQEEAMKMSKAKKFGAYKAINYDWNDNVAPVWVYNMDKKNVILSTLGKMFKAPWKRLKKGKYTIGTPVEVRLLVDYAPINDPEPATLIKSSDDSFKFRVLKKATEEDRYVFGIVLEPLTGKGSDVDLQDDYYSKETIHKASDTWMISNHANGINHTKWADDRITVLQNYIAPVDFEFGDETIKKGTWLMGARINDDDLWEDVKNGDYEGWSIGGMGVTIYDNDNE